MAFIIKGCSTSFLHRGQCRALVVGAHNSQPSEKKSNQPHALTERPHDGTVKAWPQPKPTPRRVPGCARHAFDRVAPLCVQSAAKRMLARTTEVERMENYQISCLCPSSPSQTLYPSLPPSLPPSIPPSLPPLRDCALNDARSSRSTLKAMDFMCACVGVCVCVCVAPGGAMGKIRPVECV